MTKFKQICTPSINFNQDKKNSIVIINTNSSSGSALGHFAGIKSEVEEVGQQAKLARINENELGEEEADRSGCFNIVSAECILGEKFKNGNNGRLNKFLIGNIHVKLYRRILKFKK